MSNAEDIMLSRWRELNRQLPPAEHLKSSIIEEELLTPNKRPSRRESRRAMRALRVNSGFYFENEERNRRIIKLHNEGLSYPNIAQMLHITKNIVVGVVTRNNMTQSWTSVIKPVDKEDIRLIENTEYMKQNPRTFETHIIRYGGEESMIKHKHYLVIKALRDNKREYFPADELIVIYYNGKEVPKSAKECFRKYMREVRERIEVLGLTIVNKPYSGYKLAGF